jgi:hypothetical protein
MSATPSSSKLTSILIIFTGLTCDLFDRKARDYQNALAAQIEEKKRMKEEEKRRVEDEKRRELEQYIRSEYRGSVPDYVKEQLSPRRQSYDNGSKAIPPTKPKALIPPGQSIYNLRGGNARDSRDDDDEPRAGDRSRRIKNIDQDDDDSVASLAPRKSNHRHEPHAYDEHSTDGLDYSDDDYEQNSHRPVIRSKNKKAVMKKLPAADYDELAELCSNLLVQQKQLQDEVRKQAEVIEVSDNIMISHT